VRRTCATPDAERCFEVGMSDDLVKLGWYKFVEKADEPLRELF
jgi:hypothetical protein